MKTQLSKNFYLHEFLRSQTAERSGIDMTPPDEVFLNLEELCRSVLQPIRDALGPVHITSGYRPRELNRLIGGSKSSQHLTGQAADFVISGRTPLEVCQAVELSLLPFDQCIHEFGRWVHISIPLPSSDPRRQLLTATHNDGRTVYLPGIHPIEGEDL